MSVFDVLKNNSGRDDVGVYMAYATYEAHLRQAQQEKVDEIIKLLEEMAKSTFPGDVWHINPFDYAIALIKGESK